MAKLNIRQRAAIAATIRRFAEEAIARGMPPWQRDTCPACGGFKPKAGFVPYPDGKLCGECALEFEIALAEKEVPGLAQFVERRQPRRRKGRELSAV